MKSALQPGERNSVCRGHFTSSGSATHICGCPAQHLVRRGDFGGVNSLLLPSLSLWLELRAPGGEDQCLYLVCIPAALGLTLHVVALGVTFRSHPEVVAVFDIRVFIMAPLYKGNKRRKVRENRAYHPSPGTGFPQGVNVPDPEPEARSPAPQLPPDGFHGSTLTAPPGGPPPELRVLQAQKMFIFASASSQGNYR
ncbi:hypothetical protein E5288_WYG012968 [Bos mutus]|uniref:Uncharacterized protein n=1 Tax=Bos mutus TaxID=72004 RepID=A0A6B0R8R4_9CETA|nr:hypothetical protein [Bos mutus]